MGKSLILVASLAAMCRSAIGAALIVSSSTTASAQACGLVSILSGETRLATVKHDPDPPYQGYETFLIRNNARDSDGILTASIKGELIPQRWGFDLQTPAGKRVATVNYDGLGLTVIDTSEDKVCEQHEVTFRPEKGSAVAVLDRGKRIGIITAFSRKLLRP